MKKVRGIACLIGGVFLGSLGAIEMVDVPAGRFKRGKQEVEIRNQYRMGKYPITRQEFKEICGQDPSEEESSSGKEAPVQNVNWYQAISFCNKLSLKEGLEEVYQVEDVDFKELSFKETKASERAISLKAAIKLANAHTFCATILHGRTLWHEPRQPRRQLEQHSHQLHRRQPVGGPFFIPLLNCYIWPE